MQMIISILALLLSAAAFIHSMMTRKAAERLTSAEKRTHCLAELYGIQARYYPLTQKLIELKSQMHRSHVKEMGEVEEVLEESYQEVESLAEALSLVCNEKASPVEIESAKPRIESMKLRQQGLQERYEGFKQLSNNPGVYFG